MPSHSSPIAPAAALESPLSIGQCATLACLLEVSSPKPGNVHRGADFDDLTFVDFMASAVAIGPPLESAAHTSAGMAAIAAIRATRAVVRTNTNLGTVLLLAPLAAVPRSTTLESGIGSVLSQLTAQDSAAIYAAIRLAQPGGMGTVSEMDVAADAPHSILDAMRLAESRDLVARQYVSEFSLVLQEVTPHLIAGPQRGWSLTETIIHTQMQLLSRYGDSLIARKCGPEVSREAAGRAAHVLDSGPPGDNNYLAALSDFDFWLRSDHHSRNPGTTADLLAAGLFAALREGFLSPPFH